MLAGDCPNFRVSENGTVPFTLAGRIFEQFGHSLIPTAARNPTVFAVSSSLSEWETRGSVGTTDGPGTVSLHRVVSKRIRNPAIRYPTLILLIFTRV